MSLIFEVPTGILADHWSRKKMLVLSGLFFCLCYLVWIFSNSFLLFLLGFMFRTLGSTFSSGTLQAYLYDFLKSHNIENAFEKIWGRGNAFRTLGIGVAVLTGGFLSQVSYIPVLIISCCSVLVISLVAVFWPEIRQKKSTGEVKYFYFLRNSLKTIKSSRSLIYVVLFSTLIISILANLEEYNDVYLNYLGFPNSLIGIVFAFATLGQSIASIFAHKFKNYSKEVLNIVALLGFFVLILASLLKTPFMALGVLFLGVLLEFCNVLNEGIIQRESVPSQRATISSLNKLLANLIPFQMIFGIVANKYNIQKSYLVFSVFILLYFFILILDKIFLKRNISNGTFEQKTY